jgi:hypothetical protein
MALGGSVVLAILVAIMAGCGPKAPLAPAGYYGRTLAMAEVIEKINQNNQAIPTLYAKHYTEASIIDKKGKTRFVNTGGDVFVRKPRELLMRGKKDPFGKVFEIGSTPERFWLTVYVDEPTRWWGYYRNVGKPCVQDMPLRPDVIGEVLGIGNINTNFNAVPVPTMRFNNDLDVYMLTWQTKLADRWYTEKEIWYDRKTLLPRKVLLFDPNGRIILRANLDRHRGVEAPNVPRERWPVVATAYELFFPDTRSTMKIELSDLVLINKAGHPREGTIVFKEDPEAKEIQIDADCK